MAAAALTATLALPGAEAQDDDTRAIINNLRRQIEELDQKVKVLERTGEIAAEEAEKKKLTAPSIKFDDKGFSATSADKKFNLKIRGYMQADGRFYANDANGFAGSNTNDQFLLRRVRPIFEGKVYDNFEFRIMPDFAPNTATQPQNILQDAYINVNYIPELQFQVGKYKGPVGLERLQSGTALSFVERGFPTNLVPNREIGAMFHGQLLNERLGYQVGIFNGANDGSNAVIPPTDDDFEFEGRIFAHPFKEFSEFDPIRGLGVGVAGTYGNKDNTAPFSYVSYGQQPFVNYTAGTVIDGATWRVSPQAYWYWNRFGLLAEYVVSQEKLVNGAVNRRGENTAWQVVGNVVLFGGDASYKGVKVEKPFDFGQGGWGALELVGRYGELDVADDFLQPGSALITRATSASEAEGYSIGLNWYLNNNIKATIDYSHTGFSGVGAVGGTSVTETDENAIFTRLQLSF